MNLDKGTRLGAYEILGSIGAGGMGEVYRAADTRLHREVAIKVSAERFSERFEREARAIASLNHANVCTRFTFNAGVERYPVRSPDASQIAFISTSGSELSRKASNGAGEAELLFKSPEGKAIQDWSPDGRYLLYAVQDPQTSWDLWILPLQGEPKPIPFLVTPFIEGQARFSADGRWVVYTSTESGRFEIYVRPFAPPGSSTPAPGGKWMVSNGGGAQPRWRADGKEILYLSPAGKLISVDVVAAGPSLQVSVPKPLFDVTISGGAMPGPAVSC